MSAKQYTCPIHGPVTYIITAGASLCGKCYDEFLQKNVSKVQEAQMPSDVIFFNNGLLGVGYANGVITLAYHFKDLAGASFPVGSIYALEIRQVINPQGQVLISQIQPIVKTQGGSAFLPAITTDPRYLPYARAALNAEYTIPPPQGIPPP